MARWCVTLEILSPASCPIQIILLTLRVLTGSITRGNCEHQQYSHIHTHTHTHSHTHTHTIVYCLDFTRDNMWLSQADKFREATQASSTTIIILCPFSFLFYLLQAIFKGKDGPCHFSPPPRPPPPLLSTRPTSVTDMLLSQEKKIRKLYNFKFFCFHTFFWKFSFETYYSNKLHYYITLHYCTLQIICFHSLYIFLRYERKCLMFSSCVHLACTVVTYH